MKRTLPLAICALIAALSFTSAAHAQAGRYDNVAFSSSGRFAPGVNVAVCQQLATTGASVTSNVATYTFGSNPITQGFVSGATLTVFGFTGGDTYFNGTFTIASTSASTISVALVHANASAGTNGTVYQIGTSTQACAPLATLYTFYTALTTSPNPLTADGLGNYGFWAVPGQYEVQLYGPTVTTSFFYVSMACVPNASVTCVGTFSGSVANGQVAYGAGANVFASDGSLLHSPGGNTSLSATSPATNVANFNSPSLLFLSNYWNGAASSLDTWTLGVTLAAGANPASTFTISNPRASSNFNVQADGVTISGSSVSPLVCLAGFTSGRFCLQPLTNQGSANAMAPPTVNPTRNNQCFAGTTGNPIVTHWQDCSIVWASIDLTNQNAAIGTTTILNTTSMGGAGQYQFVWDAKVTTAAGATSTLGAMTVIYTDPDGIAQTITAGALSKAGAIETTDTGNSTTTVLIGVPLTLNCGAATNIQYSFAYASNAANAMLYNLHIRIIEVD